LAHELEALDASTGATSWKLARLDVGELLASDDRVAVFDGDGLVRILDAATGHTIGAIPEGRPTWQSEVAAADGVVYALVRDREGARATLVGIDLASGKEVWKTSSIEVTTSASTDSGGVAVTGSEVVFCTQDGALHGVDRGTGRPTFEYGLGHCNPIVAARTARGLTLFVARDESTEVLGPRWAAAESATVAGKVTLNGEPLARARVTAFGASTTADALGRYELKIRAAGRVVVQARGMGKETEKCDALAKGSAEPVELTGRREYSIDVDTQQNCSCGL